MPNDANKPIVVHVVTSLDFGGVESHMETLANHAAGTSMRLVFCAMGSGGAVERKLKAAGAQVICLEESVRLPGVSAILGLYRLFRRLRPLVVHTHGAEANFCGLIAAWLARVPVRVGEEIGMPGHSRKARAAFRAVYTLSHRVVGISQAVADWLVASGEAPLRKVRRLYNPVELPEFAQEQPSDATLFRMGFVGRLEAVKNPEVLIDVLARLHQAGIRAQLWLIGDGSQRAKLERQVDAAGLADWVVFHGYRDDPSGLVRQCHVYVQPSLSEGFGLAFVEAMGCGVPVIVTATGGAAEIVEHGVTGWIVPSPEVSVLTDALSQAQALGGQGLSAMGRKARVSVERRFLPGAYLSELHDLYAQVRGAARASTKI
ncbi:MAG: glycosyltransferase [Luteimonas sp.]